MKKNILPVLLLILALLLPLGVSAAETMPPDSRTEAFYNISAIPFSWNPTGEISGEAELILNLTADRLYYLSADGQTLIPSLAAELPQDVTAEFAGSYGIPQGAARGYAFRIDLFPEARWENGASVTAADFLMSVQERIDSRMLGLALAGLTDFYEGREKVTDGIISLKDAGFSSRKEAEEQGHTAFYVDTSRFWGLDSGWVSISDRTRLKDAAIPSGVTEMYVSGAYLYSRYLADDAALSRYQSRFLGVSAEPAYVTREDIGIFAPDDVTLILILETPTTAEALALKLRDLIPVPRSKFAENYATSPSTYTACGPYRIVSVKDGVMELAPNPHYAGQNPVFRADVLRLTEIGA